MSVNHTYDYSGYENAVAAYYWKCEQSFDSCQIIELTSPDSQCQETWIMSDDISWLEASKRTFELGTRQDPGESKQNVVQKIGKLTLKRTSTYED